VKALLKTRATKGGVELVDRPVPSLAAQDVLIRVRMAAICGTDLHIYEWNPWAAANYKLPLPLGHEFCGEVVAIGEGVSKTKVGDKVSGETHLGCGHCEQCRSGRKHTCRNLQLFSKMGLGCFAEYTALPEELVRVVPSGISDSYAAVMEPLGIAVRAVAEASVSGEDILIIGCGPVGLFAIVAAKTLGAHKVIAADLSPQRLELATVAGAQVVCNPAKDNLVDKALTATSGLGVKVVIETSGSPAGIKNSFAAMAKGSRMLMVGLPSVPVDFDIAKDIITRETTVTGVYGRRIDQTWLLVEKLLLANQLPIDPLLTHTFPLEQYQAAFEEADSRTSGKILLIF
jgi:threonine 3-dehydrogenase